MGNNSEILRSLAKEARELQGGLNQEEITSAESKNDNGFILTLAEYPDIIISKQTPKITRHLIIMPSASTCFIKTENNKSGDTTSEIMTEENYASFTSGMPDIRMPKGFWLSELSKGKATAKRLLQIFADKMLIEAINKNCIPTSVDIMNVTSKYCMPEEQLIKAYKANPDLMREYAKDKSSKGFELIYQEPVFVQDIVRFFGIENARDFLNEYNDALIALHYTGDGYKRRNGYNIHEGRRVPFKWETEAPDKDAEKLRKHICMSSIPNILMKYSSFKEYMLYDSVHLGYALDAYEFLSIWRDTLEMEYQLYGKLTEKYPKNLPTLHNQLSYKCKVMQQQIDEQKFNAQCERTAAYEGEYKGYVFIAPKKRQDFYDEATAQGNCLAGYVGAFTDGRCMIMFMRKKKTPDKSYITVKLNEGILSDAKYARNANVAQHEMLILQEWITKCNKVLYAA